MDFARISSSWPTFKHSEQVGSLREYLKLYTRNQIEAGDYLERFLADTKINAKVLMYNSLLHPLKLKISSVNAQDVQTFTKLCQNVSELY